MNVAVVCTALLGLLVFGLGLRVSLLRGRVQTVIGHASDPTDPLHKAVRAHANAAEYAPMGAILILALASRGAGGWLAWVFAGFTVCRYLHAAGMTTGRSLAEPSPLRFAGALGTYVFGVVLAVALLFS
jgi:uncharacterized membrane protein YecN with MAPEG domain